MMYSISKRLTFTICFIMTGLIVGSVGGAHAQVRASTADQERTSKITPGYYQGMQRKVKILQLHDFTQQFTLSVRTHPDRIAPEERLRILQELSIGEKLGVEVEALDYSAPDDLVLGYEGGSVEINRIKRNAQGQLSIWATFRDENGQFIEPKPNDIHSITFGNENVCFDVVSIEKHGEPIYVSLMVDKSGSMANVINEVASSAKRFLSQLPVNAICRVFSFDTQMHRLHDGEQIACDSRHINLDLKAEGGTDIYTGLHAEFSRYNQPRYQDASRMVLIITDGQIAPDQVGKEALMQHKRDTKNFVYFLGSKDESSLEGLADNFLKDTGNLGFTLGQYFTVLNRAIETQRVLTKVPCI